MTALAWNVTITFSPTGSFRLHADARLTAGLDHLTGCGDTRKHPSDPHVPEVAAEVAAARALTDLAEQLQQLAGDRMQAWDRPGRDPAARDQILPVRHRSLDQPMESTAALV